VTLRELSERCMGNAALAELLLEKFETQLRTELAEIQRLLIAKDAEGLTRVAHALKGAAAAVAAHRVCDLAAQVESRARGGQLDQVRPALGALGAEAERFGTYLPAARESLRRGTIDEATQPEAAS
jgi:HPt (histidine-containing phosphotransfer) domain-containing protein